MDDLEIMHARDRLRSGLTHPLLRMAKIAKTDLRKIFVINAEKTSGRLMSRHDFLALDLSEIGEWAEVGEFDVNDWQRSS